MNKTNIYEDSQSVINYLDSFIINTWIVKDYTTRRVIASKKHSRDAALNDVIKNCENNEQLSLIEIRAGNKEGELTRNAILMKCAGYMDGDEAQPVIMDNKRSGSEDIKELLISTLDGISNKGEREEAYNAKIIQLEKENEKLRGEIQHLKLESKMQSQIEAINARLENKNSTENTVRFLGEVAGNVIGAMLGNNLTTMNGASEESKKENLPAKREPVKKSSFEIE